MSRPARNPKRARKIFSSVFNNELKAACGLIADVFDFAGAPRTCARVRRCVLWLGSTSSGL